MGALLYCLVEQNTWSWQAGRKQAGRQAAGRQAGSRQAGRRQTGRQAADRQRQTANRQTGRQMGAWWVWIHLILWFSAIFLVSERAEQSSLNETVPSDWRAHERD